MNREHPIGRPYHLAPAFCAVSVKVLAAAALACLAVSLLGLTQEIGRHYMHSWLVSFAFYLSISLGGLFMVMIHHVTGARWSTSLRRIAEQIARLIPLLAVLLVPIVLLMNHSSLLYDWTNPKWLEDHPLVEMKTAYLNVSFFVIRMVVYFAVWIGLVGILWRRSVRQDRTGDPALTVAMRRWSPPGLILFGLTVTFASFDLLMSLEPAWYSTIFGVYYFAGSVVGILSFMVLVIFMLDIMGVAGRAISREHYHDMGKLLFGFVLFWAYIAFSQVLLIWYGNIPEETLWLKQRWEGGWRGVSLLLLFGHFVIPFLLLLPRTVKRLKPAMAAISAWLLLMHYLDLYWVVMPAAGAGHAAFHWSDVFILLGMGALLLAVLIHLLGRTAVVPVRDPLLADSMAIDRM